MQAEGIGGEVSSRVQESTSRRSLLLGNGGSARVGEGEMGLLSRKIDISKALFDRKLAKLFQEANFYD